MAERGKLLSFSDNADMCLGGMFHVDFFFSHRKSIDTSSIQNNFFLINPQSNEHVPGTDITLSLQDYRANGGI